MGLPTALDGYQDGYGLYSAYFVPGAIDPTGKSTEGCTGRWDSFAVRARAGDWWLEWGDFSLSWYGISAVDICVNVNIEAEGSIVCSECCPRSRIDGQLFAGPVHKVCISVEVPWLLAVPLAALMGAPIPGTRLIAVAGMGAFALRVSQRLMNLYPRLGRILNAKRALERTIRRDTGLPTRLCGG